MKLFNKKTDAQLVAEIHNEIDTAQDRLLQQAKQIIDSYLPDDKAERLKNVGFINTETVVKYDDKMSAIVKSKEEAELIEYYKINYPFQKFITEDEMDRICKKYDLVYAPVANYIKDVPEKNLREIENAKSLNECDAAKDIIWCELKKDSSFSLFSSDGGNWCGIWGKEWYRIPKKIEGVHFHNHFEADRYLKLNFGFTTTYLVKKVINHTIHRSGLFIAAPRSHFNLKGLEKQRQYGMLKPTFTIVEPKDPIVFRYCKGGIQIISKWGIEGEDKGLVNESLN